MPDTHGSEERHSALIVHAHADLEITDEDFARIRQILLRHGNFSLDAYKDRCVRRRIAIRVRASHCSSAREYCDILQTHPAEVDHLVKVLTIHVSQFFRNFSTFEQIRLEIIPMLFATARRLGRSRLRFWSLGCAGGEEPYTLALILAEHFAEELLEIPVTITGTDIDAATIEQAKLGVYGHERLLELPLNYLENYFSEAGTKYQLAPEIMAMVDFRVGDIFDPQIYQNADLVLCRNVMIYFSRTQQEKIFYNIARVLDANGFMVLGKSETILGDCRHRFQTICPVERIYRPAAV